MSEANSVSSSAPTSAPNDEYVYITDSKDLPTMLRISNVLRRIVDFIGKWASWLIVPLVLITAFDVILRKSGLQYDLKQQFGDAFESTILQELEWHFHTGLFALVLGFGYIYNTHVRVDLVRETLSMRKKAWLEFLGLVFFLIPFCLVVIYFSFIYAYDSYQIGEISASTIGLTNRWIIKSVLVVGLILAAFAGFAVLFQVITILWGPKNIRYDLMTIDWPEDEGTKIEGKTRLKLEDLKVDERIYGPGGAPDPAPPPSR